MADLAEITPIVERKLAAIGFELYDIKYFRAGKRSMLRLFVDKPGGVTIDDCERVSHEISVVLDVEEFSNTPYNLEVSSPGLDRPLKTAKDYRRVVGQRVTINLQEPVEGKMVLTGVVLSSEDETVRLRTDETELQVPVASVQSGRLEIEFG
jgi:ribosome maturation factor RimP